MIGLTIRTLMASCLMLTVAAAAPPAPEQATPVFYGIMAQTHHAVDDELLNDR